MTLYEPHRPLDREYSGPFCLGPSREVNQSRGKLIAIITYDLKNGTEKVERVSDLEKKTQSGNPLLLT
jgi:hypothetical protein